MSDKRRKNNVMSMWFWIFLLMLLLLNRHTSYCLVFCHSTFCFSLLSKSQVALFNCFFLSKLIAFLGKQFRLSRKQNALCELLELIVKNDPVPGARTSSMEASTKHRSMRSFEFRELPYYRFLLLSKVGWISWYHVHSLKNLISRFFNFVCWNTV